MVKNRYEILGDVTVIFLKRRGGTVLETLIDTEDLEKVKAYTWHAYKSSDGERYYAKSSKNENGTCFPIRLHRLIADPPEGFYVDHINHNTLDNRKSNLRVVTNKENMQNRRGAQRNSRSGIRGIQWDNLRQKWRARITLNGKGIHIGVFEDLEEAKKAVSEARRKYMPFSALDQLNSK